MLIKNCVKLYYINKVGLFNGQTRLLFMNDNAKEVFFLIIEIISTPNFHNTCRRV